MARQQESLQEEHKHVKQYPVGRPVMHGTNGIVSAGHCLTATSAMRMLLSGGNAFDAAVAAGFTAAVVEPTSSYSLASEASFMLYHAPSRQLRSLSGQGVAAGRATVDLFKQKGLDKIPTGPGRNAGLSFTVPGVVDAYIVMLETYGTKTISEVIAPAFDYAQNGFPMYEQMRRKLQSPKIIEQFQHYPPGATEVFYSGGEPYQAGQRVVQEQLAATLGKLIAAEAGADGNRLNGLQAVRELFYRGDIAKAIVRCSDQWGGLLSGEDLTNYHATFEEPLSTTFLGYDICGQSTWTQGAILLQALNILEHFNPDISKALRAMGHNSPHYIHTVTEAVKLAFADRERHYGDPNFASIPIDGLLSKEYAAERARLFQEDKAGPELPEAGDPWRYSKGAETPEPRATVMSTPITGDGGSQGNDGTTHFAVIDRDGNMVSATPSGGDFSKSVFLPELGCALSTRSEMFFLDSQHPNGLEPGKRPRTTLVNYIVCKEGEPIMTVGCPGGDHQAQANLQLILNVLVFGMDPQQAVEAPRFGCWSMVNSFYPRAYLPGQLNVEPTIPGEVRSKLAEMGHKVVEDPECGAGAILTQRDPQTGVMSVGADPRRVTYAVGW